MSGVEIYPALSEFDGYTHGLSTRVPGLLIATSEKEAAIKSLAPYHEAVLRDCSIATEDVVYAEQVHGAEVALVTRETESTLIPAVDGLATQDQGIALGIYVADCAAVWVVDPVTRSHSVLHSGKTGSALGIVKRALDLMEENWGTNPADVIVQVSPCIRPPAYEVDFADQIRRDAIDRGVPVGQFFDSHVCTASFPERYYSYRREKGHTGRMLAFGQWS